MISSFRNQQYNNKNEVVRSYNLKKSEFLQRLKTVSDVVEITYPDGGIYIGQLNNTTKLREGKGIYTYQCGDIYLGSWKDDIFHGQGIYIFTNGEIFDGLINYGVMEGRGIYFYDNGVAYYDGTWKNNLKHGDGIYYS